MQAQKKPKYLKNKHLSYLGGPILFTAPHSKKLMRGGQEYNEKQRIHYRQTYTSWIVTQLAQMTSLNKKQMNSFCFWGETKKINQEDLDPNYLLPKNAQKSPFHLILHAWAMRHHKMPIFHVDIHGKLNRKNNCQIEVGIQSIRWHWKGDPLIKMFETHFEKKMNHVFGDLKFRGFQCSFNVDPQLHGLWAGDMQTMTQQAIKLGIPSCQMQIPNEVRKKLFKDEKLMIRFANLIKEFYFQYIIPYHEKKTHPLKIDQELGNKFKASIINQKQIKQLQQQVKRLETKEQLDLNLKKI